MSPLESLKHSRKFWLAAFAVVQTVLFQLIPNFPPDVWQAVNTLVAILIAAIAAEDAATKLNRKPPQ